MDKIDKNEVKHIADLAHLYLTDAEIDRFSSDLTTILQYINQLDQIKIDSVSPSNSLSNVWREDEVTNGNMRDQLLKNAPNQSGGFIKVKGVFAGDGVQMTENGR